MLAGWQQPHMSKGMRHAMSASLMHHHAQPSDMLSASLQYLRAGVSCVKCHIVVEGRGSSPQAHCSLIACMVVVLACARHGHTRIESPVFRCA